MKNFFTALSIIATFLFTAVTTGAQEFENSKLTSQTFMAAFFLNENEGWLADNKGKLWHTTDAAQTWDSLSVSKNFVQLQFISSENGFALASGAAYKTTNGGQAWSEISLPENSTPKALCFLDGSTGYISSFEKIFKTADGGASWQLVNDTDELNATPVFGLYKSLAGTGQLYLVGERGTVSKWE
jgi:photosystem II stability/assembly factor-like uncharacterized protein